MVGKVRGLRQDVQRKISKLRNESLIEQEKRAEQAFPCSASSIESLPSGSGSSKHHQWKIINLFTFYFK